MSDDDDDDDGGEVGSYWLDTTGNGAAGADTGDASSGDEEVIGFGGVLSES
jgi:hypothetical protein